jgi:hypothetical protein
VRTGRFRRCCGPRALGRLREVARGVAGDFTGAQHGSARLFGEVHLPTVENSLTGCLFIAACAVLAGVFVSSPLAAFCKEANLKGPIALALIVGPVIGGAWAGSAAHQWVGGVVKQIREDAARRDRREQEQAPVAAEAQSPPREPEPRILACEKCGQKLRVPALPSELLVTCKFCGHRFSCPPG